jgi:hypothetical protein
MITQQRLHELFDYQDGTLIRKVGVAAGKIAGTLDTSTGYWRINIDKKMYRLHRMIFLYHNGYLTEGLQIDHADGNRNNNLIDNLREVTNQQNQFNAKTSSRNKSGVKGVSWNKAKQKWQVYIMVDGKNKFIGYYDILEEAEAAAIAGREKYHGTFARHD